MKYNIHLQVYDGPLDLLYDMISKQKIDIKDISITEITKQYLSYLEMLDKMDLEITSEFITMASKLLQIKSRYLLYKQKDDEEEEDPRLELMEKLEEYKKYKLAAQDLKSNVTDLSEVFYRKKEEIVIDEKIDLEDISIDAIKMILPHILKIKTTEEPEYKDDRLNKIVKGRIVSVEEKMVYIRDIIREKECVHFTNIIEDCDKNEVIATFLSILELIKAKEITVEQDIFFDDILIKKSSE
ncbi:segregation and condensation protein A [Romboutsia ilealis]|uniref:Segregation and condensation protein A n=1 Tax=Romboutsia faecis TaxID=2764597 RepID=A0ABR7JMI8_9FIRM|nr:segregation/condensation protein A [Romboutsia faecis]MBC5996132.1 segregation/condensation protein A [Romboutsia faecis]MRN23332.1 segregation and condensation protein A [Romboutsia ilealis]